MPTPTEQFSSANHNDSPSVTRSELDTTHLGWAKAGKPDFGYQLHATRVNLTLSVLNYGEGRLGAETIHFRLSRPIEGCDHFRTVNGKALFDESGKRLLIHDPYFLIVLDAQTMQSWHLDLPPQTFFHQLGWQGDSLTGTLIRHREPKGDIASFGPWSWEQIKQTWQTGLGKAANGLFPSKQLHAATIRKPDSAPPPALEATEIKPLSSPQPVNRKPTAIRSVTALLDPFPGVNPQAKIKTESTIPDLSTPLEFGLRKGYLSRMGIFTGIGVSLIGSLASGGQMFWLSIVAGILVAVFGICYESIQRDTARIILNEEGIIDKYSSYGLIRWSDIREAKLGYFRGRRFILLDVDNEQRYLQRLSSFGRFALRHSPVPGFRTIQIGISGLEVSDLTILDLVQKMVTKERSKAQK